MIELELQDRTKWDKKLIQAATAFLAKSRNTGTITSYHLEATISSIHCMAESFESTDWESITVCYDKLLELEDNPVIRINRAIAISKWKGPELGAKQLDKIENIISKPIKQLFYAAKAAMFFQEKKYEMAKTYYQVAMDHSKHEMDKKFLAKKIQLCNTNNIGLN
mgnify:FL=1